ncbi:hypothetical protein C8A01DRAFT_18688 [Parachaetomium inaequale]|uniref:RING-type domain-containing protein n=1 Tax=Parachaetomium inaequale TaxID=2588326 RepID=A0AAN6SP43_9PEZI|nr:hypothetical protein C8A01DRAFT_18688 [Parachaetomium inaequale]
MATTRDDLELSRRNPRSNSSIGTGSSSPRIRVCVFIEPAPSYGQLKADGGVTKIPPDQRGPSVEWQVVSSSINYWFQPLLVHRADHKLYTRISVICLEGFQDESLVRLLPCRHLFHAECIASWFLAHHDTCPICMAHNSHALLREETLPVPPPPAMLVL